jgi:alkanesulfonate monooxygenase SsuD/methylene tetrahydromethanopterin reductase-like flavin-dependent oxidoreductase (luciferase family)
VKFGLALPHYGYSMPDHGPTSFEQVTEAALEAERLGFDSVWVSDHFYLSVAKYGAGDELHAALEPMTTLGALIPATERVELGTLVLSMPFRHPAVLARQARSLDALSGGRVRLGVGSGWYEDEFIDFGYEFGTAGSRFRALDDGLQVLRDQGAPRVFVGAKGGPRALRSIVRHADGWNHSWRTTPAAYSERMAELERLCDEEGRDPASVHRSIGSYTLVGEDERDLVERFRAMQRWTPNGALDGELLEDWARDSLTGTPQQVLEKVDAYAALGVEEMIICPSSLPFAITQIDSLELFATEIISAV